MSERKVVVHFDFLCNEHGGKEISDIQRSCKVCGVRTNLGKMTMSEMD